MRALVLWFASHPLLQLLALALVGAVVDATTWADKMITRVKNASADWEAGVASPRRSPTAAMKAAAGVELTMASSASFVARSARPPVKRVIAWGSPGRLMAAAAPWIGAETRMLENLRGMRAIKTA